MKKIIVDLTDDTIGMIAIMLKCKRIAIKRMGWTERKFRKYQKEALKGDFTNFLRVTSDYFDEYLEFTW